jgi:hypothetical protein
LAQPARYGPLFTKPFRASIVARARFIEDLVIEQAGRGLTQYVILGAGLDSFAQRRPEIASNLQVFEIDQPGPQEWKRQRLIEHKSVFSNQRKSWNWLANAASKTRDMFLLLILPRGILQEEPMAFAHRKMQKSY